MKKVIAQLKPILHDVFNYLHTHPEVSWQEYNTTQYIQRLLEERGFSVQAFADCPGLVAHMGTGGTCVALRTDMDALWQEVDGEFRANHSCGHDAHMTMVIGAMLVLQQVGVPENGRLKFIFQPAEEKGEGALKMLEMNVLDDVDYLYGVHLRPIQELQDGEAAPAIHHGAAAFLEGDIVGQDAHGARPHLGQNAIEVGASLIHEMKNIHLNPMVPYTAKMTKLHADGGATNIIPGKASFSIDVRAQTNAVMEELIQKIYTITETVAKLYGVTIQLHTTSRMVAAENHDEAIGLIQRALIDTIPASRIQPPIVTSGGEDFHFYTVHKPNIKGTMLGLGCGLAPGLHHPNMTFNYEALYTGVEILARTVLHTLWQKGESS